MSNLRDEKEIKEKLEKLNERLGFYENEFMHGKDFEMYNEYCEKIRELRIEIKAYKWVLKMKI